MSQQGRILLREREDIELIEFPNMISAKDFEAMLRQQAPVHGVALGATRFGEPELEASKDMKVVTRIVRAWSLICCSPVVRRTDGPVRSLHGLCTECAPGARLHW